MEWLCNWLTVKIKLWLNVLYNRATILQQINIQTFEDIGVPRNKVTAPIRPIPVSIKFLQWMVARSIFSEET